MSALEDVITAVQAVVAADVSGVSVPAYVPEQMNIDPLILVYPNAGLWRWGTACNANGNRARWGVHTLTIRVHVYRKELPVSSARIYPFSESVPLALLKGYQADKFGGTVVCMGDYTNPGADVPITYTFEPNDIADIPTLSWTFKLTVSVEDEVIP